MWQSIIELIIQFFKSISSVSDTTKELVPVIEKKQEIRTPVQEQEAENDTIRKKEKKYELLSREIRKDLKHGYEPNEIIAHYKLSIGEDLTDIVNREFENLKENKKRLKSFNKNKKKLS
jgi:uncharacterized protein Yka (UPF0111/DUF47 family)